MSEKLKLSVAIPFYNNASTLADAIRSVFAQTYQDWELILVDDGSTDDSLEIALAVRDSRVRVISDGANRKLPARLNQIARLARGEYLARMDADDLMHPDRLEHQVEYLDNHPGVDLVSTGLVTIDLNNRPIGKRIPASKTLVAKEILLSRGIFHPSVMARLHWFVDNPYDEHARNEDFDLWIRSYAKNRLAATRLLLPLFFYREEHSLTPEHMFTTLKSKHKILRSHAPALCGRFQTWRLLARSYWKTFVYRILFLTGQEMRLVRLRSQPLTEAERAEFCAVISKVLETSVPGLPNHASSIQG